MFNLTIFTELIAIAAPFTQAAPAYKARVAPPVKAAPTAQDKKVKQLIAKQTPPFIFFLFDFEIFFSISEISFCILYLSFNIFLCIFLQF